MHKPGKPDGIGSFDSGRRLFLKSFLAGSALVVLEHIGNHPVLKAWANAGPANMAHDLPRFEPKFEAGQGFPQSVAAGDPTSTGAVLWTRVDPALTEGIGGDTYDPRMVQWLDQASSPPNEAVRRAIEEGKFVMVEVADTPDFSHVVLRGYSPIWKDFDHVVKVDLDGHLQPQKTYYYRFVTRTGHVSRSGRFKTLATEDTDVASLRFAYISCQDYTNGYYHALKYAAEEEVDFVIHLGDYIYESVGDPSYQNPLPDRQIRLPGGRSKAFSLEDYRTLHRTYRMDPHLQQLHENHAVIAIWDDHEFANDTYYPGVAPDDSPESDPERRLVANQVWFEYMPARVTFDKSKGFKDSIRIYRSVRIGNLAELILTDERLYRSPHPCGEKTLDRYFTPGCPRMNDPAQTMLGAGLSQQKEWFLDKLKNSRALWKIWCNEVQFTPLKLLSRYVNLDAWDGFAGERKEITETLRQAGVKNFITITGDLHTFEAGLILSDYDKSDGEAVGVEFMVGSVTSANLKELVEQAATGPVTSSNPLPVEAMEKIASAILGTARPLTSTLVGSVLDQLSLLIHTENPWLKCFNSSTHGYCIMELSRNKARWTAYSTGDVKKKDGGRKSLLFQCEVPRDEARIDVLKK